jgi:hypothetical protein
MSEKIFGRFLKEVLSLKINATFWKTIGDRMEPYICASLQFQEIVGEEEEHDNWNLVE